MNSYKIFFVALVMSIAGSLLYSAENDQSLYSDYFSQIYELEKNFDTKDEEFANMGSFFSFYEKRLKAIEKEILAKKSLNKKEKVSLVTYVRQVLSQVLIIRQTLMGYDSSTLIDLLKKIDRTVVIYLSKNPKLTTIDSQTLRIFAANKISLIRYDYSRAFDYVYENEIYLKEAIRLNPKNERAILDLGSFWIFDINKNEEGFSKSDHYLKKAMQSEDKHIQYLACIFYSQLCLKYFDIAKGKKFLAKAEELFPEGRFLNYVKMRFKDRKLINQS